MPRILITGASGTVASAIRAAIAGRYEIVRLFDLVSPKTSYVREEFIEGDLAEFQDVYEVSKDIDVVLHLGAIPKEGPFQRVLSANIIGTYNVFESARLQSVRRVVFASSHHVIGFYPTTLHLTPEAPPRPDTYYGASKVFGEALGSLYHDKWGLEVVSLRLGSVRERPATERELATWLSFADTARLFSAAIDTENVGHAVIYGVSDNRRKIWENGKNAADLGFFPEDDAEDFAASVEGTYLGMMHGGRFVEREISEEGPPHLH